MIMKKFFIRLRKFVSIFYPRSIYKIITRLYSMTDELEEGRTIELKRIIQESNYTTFVEVGVWKGDNIISIAKSFPQMKCYGIDPYDYRAYDNQTPEKDGKTTLIKESSEIVYQKTALIAKKYSNFFLIRKSSKEAIESFENESVDIVFIDANHSYKSVKEDIGLWLPKVKRGGYLSGHDYSIEFFGVIQAVNEILGVDNVVIRSNATWFYFKA